MKYDPGSASAKFFLFSSAIYFSLVLFQDFRFLRTVKSTQNLFTTTKQNLDVFFILIFISIVIYISLLKLNCLYLLISAYVLFILWFSSASLQLQRTTIIPYCEENLHFFSIGSSTNMNTK